MTPKQFVAKQLELPEHARVIPDRIYMVASRVGAIQMLAMCLGRTFFMNLHPTSAVTRSGITNITRTEYLVYERKAHHLPSA